MVFSGPTSTMGPGVIPEAPPWWWWGVGEEMVIPQSLLYGAGPGGLSLSHPHCAMGTDKKVLFTLPTPLTLHLARIPSPARCTLALGTCLSVPRYVVPTGFVCATATSGRTTFSYCAHSHCPHHEPPGLHSTSGKRRPFPPADCALGPATVPRGGRHRQVL